MDLGAAMRAARIEAQMTQHEVAAKYGCGSTTYGLWETNTVRVSAQDFIGVMEMLGVSVRFTKNGVMWEAKKYDKAVRVYRERF